MVDKARPGAVAGGRVSGKRAGRQPTQREPKPDRRSIQQRAVYDGQADLFNAPHDPKAKLDGIPPPSSPPRPPSPPAAPTPMPECDPADADTSVADHVNRFGAMPGDPSASKANDAGRASPQLEAWVESARSRRIEDVTSHRGIRLNGKNERCGPCPVCGGVDRFSINIIKQLWNCRCCDRGGDVIDLLRFLDGCDFFSACKTLAGEPPPPESRAKPNGKNGEDHTEASTAERKLRLRLA